MYNTFIFDFDLTLANSSKGILICFKHTLMKFGFEIPDDTTIFNTIGLTLEDAFTVLTGVTDAELKSKMRLCYVAKADVVMAKSTYFYDGAFDILNALKTKGYNIGIVSTKYRYRIVETFEAQNADVMVDKIIGGEDVKMHKPDPYGLNLMIKELDADKENVLYIGDSYIDAQTAENAGVSFAGVLTGSTSREKFSEYESFAIAENIAVLFENII